MQTPAPKRATRRLGYSFSDEDAAASHLVLHRTGVVVIPAGHTAEVRVQRLPGGSEAGEYVLWLYPVNRAPEHVPAAMAVNDTISGEVLENSADVDEFTVTLAGADELIGYLGATPQLFPGSAWLTLSGAGLASSPNIQHQANATDLEGSATGRFMVTAGQLKAEVKGVSTDVPVGQSGPSGYSIMLRHINRAPERLPTVLAANDSTPGEQIDYIGDIDEFSVATTAGQSWNGFIHAAAGGPYAELTIRQGAIQLAQGSSFSGGTALADHFTGNFTAPAAGTLTFAVESPPGLVVINRGAYRVFAYQVNRLPETVPVLIQAGDSVLSETIEMPGDVDSFAIAPGSAQAINLVAGRPNALANTLAFSYLGPNGLVSVPCYISQAGTQSFCASGIMIPPPANQYALLGSPTGDAFRGSYSFNAYAIDLAPENVSAVLVLGDTVDEAIDPLGDRDQFTFSYQKGQLLDLWAEGGGCSSGNSIIAAVLDLQGFLSFWGNCGVRSGRFDLPQSGTYTLVGAGLAGSVAEKGAYRFVLYQYPTAPEHVGSAIQPGDSIHGESMDEPGDVDDFLLSATPGSEIQIRAFYGWLSLILPGDSLSFLQGRHSMTGRFVIPPGGQVIVRVAAPRGQGPDIYTAFYGTGTGPYDLVANQIDRAPEHAPAALTLGTPVTSEDLPFEGEVDEFTFEGTSGQVVSGTLTCNQGFDLGLAVLQILDPTGTTVLGSASTHDATVGSTGGITLPATGTYIVRIQAQDDTQGKGGYQFTIQ